MKKNKLLKILIIVLVAVVLLNSILPTGAKIIYAANDTQLTKKALKILLAKFDLKDKQGGNDVYFSDNPDTDAFSWLTDDDYMQFSVSENGNLVITSRYGVDKDGYDIILPAEEAVTVEVDNFHLTNVYGDDFINYKDNPDEYKPYVLNVAGITPYEDGDGVQVFFNLDREYSEGTFSKSEYGAILTNPIDIEITDVTGKSTGVIRDMGGYAGTSAYIPEEDTDTAGFLERIISAFIRSTSLGYYALLQLIMGSGASIETLIFNQFDNTKLTLFDDMGDANTYITEIRVILNKFFSLGRNIAIVAYMIILVYMGIRIMLNAGAQKKAQYKQLFMYWAQGIVILFLFPYVIKYTIVLNNVFVEYVYQSKNNMSFYEKFTQPETGESVGNIVQVQDDMISSADRLLDKQNEDYLSVIYRYAADGGWITYAICWAVIIKEWLTLLIVYFKRLITVIFLIAIFPFVSISYAIDKIGDGKSQAFSNWYKEFALNVFLQSFHVIVYVVCISIIIGAAEVTKSNPNENWLLILITLTFLANGEDLLKSIFNMRGGGGDTVKNTATTLLAAKGARDLIKGGRQAISKRFGSQSSFGKLRQGIGNTTASAVSAGLLKSRENANALQEKYNAEQLASNVPDNTESSSDSSPQASLFDYRQLAEFALGRDSKENQDKALKMLYEALNSNDANTREEAARELSDYFSSQGAYGEKRAREFDNKMRAMATANKVASGLKNASSMLPIELNENIQVLLDFHKKGEISTAQIQDITGKSIEQLRKYTGPRIKQHTSGIPSESATTPSYSSSRSRGGSGLAGTGRASGATRVNAAGRTVAGGNRYEGVFKVAPASVQMQRIRGASAATESLNNMSQKERRKAMAATNAQMVTTTSPKEKNPGFTLRMSNFRSQPEVEKEIPVEKPNTEQIEEQVSPYADMSFAEKVKELKRINGYIEFSRYHDQYTAEDCIGFVENVRAIRESVVAEARNSSDVSKMNELNQVDDMIEQTGLDRYESILRTQIVRNNQLLDLDSDEGWQVLQDSKDYVQKERIAFAEQSEASETESERRYRMLLEEQVRLQNERKDLSKEEEKAKKDKVLLNNLKDTGKAAVGTVVDMVELPVTLGLDAMMAGAGSGSYMDSVTSAVFGGNMVDDMHHKAKGLAGDVASYVGSKTGGVASYVGSEIGSVAKKLRNRLGRNQNSSQGTSNNSGPIHLSGKKDQFEVVSIYDKVKAANRKNKNG